MLFDLTCVLIVSTCMRITDPFVYFLVIKGKERKKGGKKESKKKRKEGRKKERKMGGRGKEE